MKSNGYRPLPSPEPECASFADVLPLLGENTLDAETYAHLRQHVSTCAYCQAQAALDTRIAGVFRRYFAQPALRLFSQEELMQITDKDKRPANTGQAPPAALAVNHQRAGRSGRLRTLTAVSATAAIVVLFVVLFQGLGLGHNRVQSALHPTATPVRAITPTAAPLPDERYLTPVIAPSHPQTIYRLAPTSASATQLVFQRSADGGTIWHSFALPAQSSGPLPGILVSPVDAQEVFLTLGGELVGDNCVPQPAGNSKTILSAEKDLCGLQYVSQDGGAHWTLLHFPLSGTLGYISFLYGSSWSGYPSSAFDTLRAQGNRLYSPLALWTANYPSIRIVSSTDGGLTWQPVDNGLQSTGYNVCDYAPAPTGSTLFALLAPAASQCQAEPLPHFSLWRSDDAGGHWTQVAQLKDNVEVGMVAVSNGDGVQPAIYINTAATSCPANAYIAWSPQSGICNGAPNNLQASVDGGKTWHAAPMQGYPDPKRNPGVPLGVLSDGSVLFLVEHQFYTWKFGDLAWQRVGPAITSGFQYALVTVDSAGQQTLWVVSSQSSGAFTIHSYPL